jgi:hypothetical protein
MTEMHSVLSEFKMEWKAALQLMREDLGPQEVENNSEDDGKQEDAGAVWVQLESQVTGPRGQRAPTVVPRAALPIDSPVRIFQNAMRIWRSLN